MQLWFARGTEVSLRQQLVTQVILGILAGDLAPGQRLPSIRELARRFRLHPNTVSAGYRELERDRWLEFRRGSGVYVRARAPETPLSQELSLDHQIAGLFRAARGQGIPLAAARLRIRQWLEMQPPDHFLLIEPDAELRQILAFETQQAVKLPVKSCTLADSAFPALLEGAIPVAAPSQAAVVRAALPPASDLLALRVRSIPSSLAGWLPAPPSVLVGVASRWPNFLKLSRTMLLAAGFHNDALIFRDARKSGWQRGLQQTAAVVCDSLTAAALPRNIRVIAFPLLADDSLAELRQAEEFILNPLPRPL